MLQQRLRAPCFLCAALKIECLVDYVPSHITERLRLMSQLFFCCPNWRRWEQCLFSFSWNKTRNATSWRSMACAFCVQLKKIAKSALISWAKIYWYNSLYLVFLFLLEMANPATNECLFLFCAREIKNQMSRIHVGCFLCAALKVRVSTAMSQARICWYSICHMSYFSSFAQNKVNLAACLPFLPRQRPENQSNENVVTPCKLA